MKDWRTEAVCASTDPEVFFPVKGGEPFTAKRVCRSCPVKLDCLEWAMENPVEGVWGGTTLPERRELAHRKGRAYVEREDPVAVRRAEVRRLHGLGWIDHEIAPRLSLTVDTVRRIRRQLGLPTLDRKAS